MRAHDTSSPRSGCDDLVSLLRRHVASDTRARYGFYRRGEDRIDYQSHAMVVRRAYDFAMQLVEQGVRTNEPVLVAVAEPEPIVTAYLGTVLAGGLPVIHPIRRAFDKRAQIIGTIETAMRALGPNGHLVMEAGDSLVDDLNTSAPVIDLDLGALEGTKTPRLCVVHGSRREMALHLQSTSGTTGTSKLAVVTHGNAIANCVGLAARMQMSDGDVTVSWLPLYHDMGLIMSVILPLVTGTDSVLLSPFDFLADPTTYLRVISSERGTISTMPNFGFELASRRSRQDRLGGVDLSAWRQANCGAEPIDVRVIERFIERFAPYGFSREAIKPGYGLAEATLTVTLTGAGEPAHYVRSRMSSVASLAEIDVSETGSFDAPLPPCAPDETEVISVGSALRGLDIWLVDDHDRIIEDDDVCGEIKVAGTSVSPGYWRSDGPLDAIAQSGLRTGDIGFFHKGELYVVERIKNIIIRHGENYSALLLEHELADGLDRPRNEIVVIDSDVRPGLGRITAILGVDQKDDLAALEAGVRDAQLRLPLALEDLIFVPRGALPRTTSGKKQHAKIRTMLSDGAITVFDRIALTPMPPAPQGVLLDLVAIDAVGTTRDIVTRMARRQGDDRDRRFDAPLARSRIRLAGAFGAGRHDRGKDRARYHRRPARCDSHRWRPARGRASCKSHPTREAGSQRHAVDRVDRRRDPADEPDRDPPRRPAPAHRGPVGRRLRVAELSRTRSPPRRHRERRAVAQGVGHASELDASRRVARPLRATRSGPRRPRGCT